MIVHYTSNATANAPDPSFYDHDRPALNPVLAPGERGRFVTAKPPMVVHLHSLPEHIQKKVLAFDSTDPRLETRFVTLLLSDGSRVRNVCVEVDEDARKNEDRTFDFRSVTDVRHQVWRESDAEKDWWDPANKEWWKS